jgi:hypothetical protein
MYDLRVDIIKYLKIILTKINNSISKVEKSNDVTLVKNELIDLSLMLFKREGELNLLNKYFKEFINSKPSNTSYLEIIIELEKKCDKHNLNNQIDNAWLKYRNKIEERENDINVSDYFDDLEKEFNIQKFKFEKYNSFFKSKENSLQELQSKFEQIIEEAFAYIYLIIYGPVKLDIDTDLDFEEYSAQLGYQNEDFELKDKFNKEDREIFYNEKSFHLFKYLVSEYIEDFNNIKLAEFSDIYAFLTLGSNSNVYIRKGKGKKYREYVVRCYNLNSYTQISYREANVYKGRLKELKQIFDKKYEI